MKMVGQTKCQRPHELTLRGAHTLNSTKENYKHHCNNSHCAANDPNYAIPDYITQAQKATKKLTQRKRTPRSKSTVPTSSRKNLLELPTSFCTGSPLEIEPTDEVYCTPLTRELLRLPTPPPCSASPAPSPQQPLVKLGHEDPSILQREVSHIEQPSCSPIQQQRTSSIQLPRPSSASPPIKNIFKTNSIEIQTEAVTTKLEDAPREHTVKNSDLSDLSDASSVNTICSSVCLRSTCSVCGKIEPISPATSLAYKSNPLYNLVGLEENGDSSNSNVKPGERFGSPKGISSSNYRLFALELLCLLVLGGLLTVGFIPYFESSLRSYLLSYCSCSRRDMMAPDPSLILPQVSADGLHRGIIHWINCPLQDKPVGTTIIK